MALQSSLWQCAKARGQTYCPLLRSLVVLGASPGALFRSGNGGTERAAYAVEGVLDGIGKTANRSDCAETYQRRHQRVLNQVLSRVLLHQPLQKPLYIFHVFPLPGCLSVISTACESDAGDGPAGQVRCANRTPGPIGSKAAYVSARIECSHRPSPGLGNSGIEPAAYGVEAVLEGVRESADRGDRAKTYQGRYQRVLNQVLS